MTFIDPNGESATVAGATGGFVIGGAVALLQGKRGKEAWAAALKGGLEGAMIGSVVDTGGASLPMLLAAGALSHAAGESLERAILNKPTHLRDLSADLAWGAALPPIGGPVRSFPLGFQSREQFLAAGQRIQAALGEEAMVGIRGSSVTGIRHRTKEIVTAETFKDYDFLAISDALVEQLGGRRALQRGYIQVRGFLIDRVPQLKDAFDHIFRETRKPATLRIFTKRHFERKVNPKEVLMIK